MMKALKELDNQLGGFGRFQKWSFFLVCLAPVMTGMSVVNQVFVGLAVPYRCALPECEDASNSSYAESFLNFTTPLDGEEWSSCQVFARNRGDGNTSCDPEDFDSSRTEECSKWVYDRSMFTNTLVTEFDLTCENAWMQSLGGSVYMFGMPFGAFILGDIVDRIGRRKGIVMAVLVLSFGELVGSMSVNFYMYLAMRFISGVGSIATFQTAIITALEVVSSEWRTFCGMMIKVPFAMGETLVALFAYFIRDWRWLQFTLSIPPFFLLSFWWILPESIRWLVSRGRHAEAKQVIHRAATMNNMEVSEDVFESLSPAAAEDQEEATQKKSKRSVFDLFKSPRLRSRTLILMFSWIVITHNFYGLSSNSGNFGGNTFINFVAIMLCEIPSYIFAYLVLDKLGRKGTLVLLLLFGGMTCIVASLIRQDLNLAIVSLSIGGKFCISAAFAVMYIYTIEIFPTQYRSLGLGICSMFARIGGILAPFTAQLGTISQSLPLIIFGALSLICGTLLLLLPETLGSELPQTLEESENYGTDHSILYFSCCSWERKKTSKAED